MRSGWLLLLLIVGVIFGCDLGLILVYTVDLPPMSEVEHSRPDSIAVLYDVHGRSFGSFALQRRVLVNYDDIPAVLREAIFSAEDKNFEQRRGLSLFRVLDVGYRQLTAGAHAQGPSSISMQLARNLFPSSDKTFGRKLQELFLFIEIEHTFSKQQIFTMYSNQISLGHGVYGFEAGAEYFFNKRAHDLSLTEAALLAGLPKAPSYYSPVDYPDRAFHRRNAVLDAMLEDGVITTAEANMAKSAPLGLHIQPPANHVAPYFLEEVRRELDRQYGWDRARQTGLRVYTTLDLDLQSQANAAVLGELAAYERRRGWRGHLLNVVEGGGTLATFKHPDWTQPIVAGSYLHGVVTSVLPYAVTVELGREQATLRQEDWAWTRDKTADEFLRVGDIVYVHVTADSPEADQRGLLHATLEQDSGVEGSLFAMDNATGDVVALVGGRDFELSQVDRATQLARQSGSLFKTYVYTAAVENGARPEDSVLDTPATFPTPSGPYSAHNYDGKYLGNISLLNAFSDSRNVPALRLAEHVGIHRVISVARRFGIEENIPAYLPVALGTPELTLAEQVAAYSTFPNDGVRITPRYIRRVTNGEGDVLSEDWPKAGEAISVQAARTMMVFLESAARASGEGPAGLHHPLGGKPGTTNDFTDAWFIGFSPSLTCGTWVGYDDRQTLGENETGAKAALPLWMDFMKVAVARDPGETFAGSREEVPGGNRHAARTSKLASTRGANSGTHGF